jgi:superfamily II DNA or RNA helicase
MRELGFQRVLFLVHRGQLARQTKKAYEMVFDSTVSMGLVGGGYHEYEKDYIFATVQTLNRDEHLLRYRPEEFDCIILDEAHHSSADTYQRVMHYFRPKLWLGMTATPDKRDDNIEGRNIYEIFDHQIAYEIRLQQAMEENMLCPFHYFGISDLSMVDDRDRKSKKMTEKDFQYLTGTERVRHIIEQANYYGYSGERVKGLIFCSRIDESIALSEKFNEAGFRTIALNGSASEEERAEAFERLAMDEQDATEARQPLDYIFSVEILNEGVDIVEVNQVIMLRPTESPIVFIQQLGRGLRKSEGKEYVVVLDFIGNYKNNFMIPIALSGDRSYNKDNIRRYLLEGGRVIPGESTIHFDEVSRKQIFASVDNANFSDIKLIRENYTNLKNKLGKIPGLLDFDQYGEMDVLRIFDNHSLGSYYKFLVKYEKEYQVRLTKDEENIIEFVSKKLANGKRIHELAMLNRILTYAHGIKKMHVFSELKKTLSEEYGRTMDEKQKENLVSIMTNEFPAGTGKKTYEKCVFIEPGQDGEYQIASSFLAMLEDNAFYQMLRELVAFGISRYRRDYSNTYKDTNFVLYQKYTYEDVCRLLNWEKNEVPLNIGGYKFDKKTGTFPVFINYDKAENISDTTKYEDHFISSSSLVAISKSGRSLESEDVQNFLKAKERGIQVELFVRKNKDDKISKEFYYLGHMNASGKAREFTMPNTTKTAVEIEWILEEPVREDLYQYIVNE